MIQKPRGEYELKISEISSTSSGSVQHQIFWMLEVIAEILLDVRDNQDKPTVGMKIV